MVERHRPARKGLRPKANTLAFDIYITVERHRPARKGLRLIQI